MNQIKITVPSAIEFQLICDYAKSFNLDLDNLQAAQFFIAGINGEIAGFARIKEHSDCVELSTLGVLPRYRKKGIGKLLIDVIMKNMEAEKIHLVTVIPEYFQKYGFKLTCEVPVSLKLKKENCKFHCSSDNVTVMVSEKKILQKG